MRIDTTFICERVDVECVEYIGPSLASAEPVVLSVNTHTILAKISGVISDVMLPYHASNAAVEFHH